MKTPAPPIYHGDAHEDGRYYHAFGDVFVDADCFFTFTRHSLAEHFERYGWRAEDVRRRRPEAPRKNLFAQALFRDAEPSKRELRRVQGVAEALHGQRLCAACASLLSTPARVICERCIS